MYRLLILLLLPLMGCTTDYEKECRGWNRAPDLLAFEKCLSMSNCVASPKDILKYDRRSGYRDKMCAMARRGS